MTDPTAIPQETNAGPAGGGPPGPQGGDLGSGYGAYRQDMSADALIERARRRAALAEPAEKDGAGPAPTGGQADEAPGDIEVRELEAGGFGVFRAGVLVAGAATEQDAQAIARPPGADIGDITLDVAADIGAGVVESPRQVAGGVIDAGREMLEALDSLATWLNDNVADLSLPPTGVDVLDNPLAAAADALPDVDPAKSVTGGLIRGISQFLAGFGAGGKALGVARAAARGGNVTRAAAKGAFADAFAFDPDEANLANLLREHAELNDPVTAYLAADPGDNEAEKRFKRALEGLALGTVAEGLFRAVGAYRARRIAKRERAVSADDPLSSARDTFGEVADEDIGLGTADGPLVEVRAVGADAVPGGVGARRIGEGNARYGTIGEVEYVRLADGSLGLGRISDEIAIAADIPPADVRLARGSHNAKTGRGSGELHIEAQRGAAIREAGYADAAELVADVAEGFTQIWTGRSGRLLLVKPNGKAKLVIVELEKDGDFYSVITAGVFRKDFPRGGGRKLLWEGERRSRLAGDASPLMRGGQSEGSIAGLGTEIDPDALLLVPEGIGVAGMDAAEGGSRVFINFARIEGADDVKLTMDALAAAFAKNIKKAARGKQSQEQTAKLADELGMTVDDLLARRPGQPLNAEAALAARRLWAASAEKLLALARRAAAPNAGEVDQFNFRRMMAVHVAIQAEVIGARTETARALAAWKIPAGGGVERARAIQVMMEGMGGAELSGAMAKRIAKLAETGVHPAALAAAARRGLMAKTMDAVKESFVLGLLWSPATHLVNTGSNLGVAFQQIAERALAARISYVAGRAAGEGVERGEALAMAFGMITALGDAWRLAGRAIRTGDTGASLQKIDLPRPRAISSEAFEIASETGLGRSVDFIGNTTRVPGRLLGGEDEFFKTIGYRMELHAQALRQAVGEGLSGNAMFRRIGAIVANPPEHIRISAADAALYNTFTNKPGAWARSLLSLRNTGDLNPTFMILPFLRTPANILRYTFERSPVAPLVGQWRADIAAGAARADIALARMATGTAIMALAADYAYSGFVSGSGPRDTGKRQALERQGWRRNSVYIGGKWYSYQRTDPFGMLMGYAADMAELVKSKELDPEDLDELNELMAGAILAVSDNVIDKTYFQGVSRVFETIGDPDRFLPDYINRQVASFVPFTTLLGTVKRAVDPVSRDYNTPWEAVQARLAVFSERLPARRDLWGRARRPDEVYGRGFDLISPIRVSKVKVSPIDAELTKLGFGVRRIRKKTILGGVDINIRDFPEAYDAYVQLAGNELKHPVWGMGAMDYLNAVVSGTHEMSEVYRIYSGGPEGGRANFIRKTVREFRQLAQRQVLEDFPDLRALVTAKAGEQLQRRMPAGVPAPAGVAAVGQP